MGNVKYSEPKDYFSKDTRKKFGLGEFDTQEQNKNEQKKKENEKRNKENEELRKLFKGN